MEQCGTVSIYALTDPRNGEVRYIGKTKRTLQVRLYGHLKRPSINDKTHRGAWLRALVKKGMEPRIMLLEVVPVDEANDVEKRWIRIMRRLGCRLTNGTDGGDGGSGPYGIKRTPEQIAKAQDGRRRWLDESNGRERLSQLGKDRHANDPEFKRRLQEGIDRRWERYYAERGMTLEEARKAKAAEQALAKARGPKWKYTEEGREFYRQQGLLRWAEKTPEWQQRWLQTIREGKKGLAPACGKGHLFTEENTYWAKNGTRQCKECRRATNREWMRGYAKRKRG